MSKSRTKSTSKAKDRHAKDKHDDPVERPEGGIPYLAITPDVCKQLLEMDVDDIQRKLSEMFDLKDSPTDLKEAALLDYYVGAVWWAKEQGFSDQQLTCFFSVVHILLENVKEDKCLSVVDNIVELKKMLVGVGVEPSPTHPVVPGGMEVFDVAQGRAISKYVFTSLFQHYRLYEYMFQETQDTEIIGTDLDIEVAKQASMPFPPPLEEGIDESKYDNFLKTPPSSPTPEPQEEGEGEEEQTAEVDLDSELFSKLTPEDVREIVESVATELLGGLQNEVYAKLREKENFILSKINKIHIVQKPHH